MSKEDNFWDADPSFVTSDDEFEEEIQEEEIPEEEIEEEDSNLEDSEEEEEEDEDPVIKNGYDLFKDSIFKHLPEDYEFKATEKGFEEALEAVQGNLFNSVHEQYLEKFNDNPKVQDYLNFIIETDGKGDIEKWSAVNLKDSFTVEDITGDDKIDLQKQVIEQYYKATGIEDEYINEKIEDLEDFGKLEKEAKVAIKFLDKNKQEVNKSLVQDVKERERLERERFETNQSILNETISKTKIPKERQSRVIQEIMQPLKLKNGGEITMLDYRLNIIKNNPEHIIQLSNLLLDYNEKEGLNIGKLAERSVNTKTAKNLRSKLEEIEKNSTISKSKTSSSYETKTDKSKNADLSKGSFILG